MRICIVTSLILLLATAGAEAATDGNPHNTSKCILCHEKTPRFGVDTKNSVTFRGGKSGEDPFLCAYCHKPEENLHPMMIKPGPEALGTRVPANLPLGSSPGFEGKIVCTTCHFFHAAESEHALLRGFPGSQKPDLYKGWQDLCRECHSDNLEKRSPHAGDDRACTFCHQTRPKEGQPVDVAPKGAELCNFCHGSIQDQHFAHANPFTDAVQCFDCHDPHLGPENPARLKAEYRMAANNKATIDPHYRKALCFTCHDEGSDYPLRDEDPVALCNRCHGTGEIVSDIHPLRTVPESITPPGDWPLKDGALTCLTCHLAGHPEHRDKEKFLRGGPYQDRNDFCINCHGENTYGSRNPHLDINQMKGCEFCHADQPVPGKDTIDTVNLIADPNVLCIRCHEASPHPASFVHTMTLEAERAGKIPEALPLYRQVKIVCATCHNPHIEEVDGHKLRGGVTGMEVCGFCHKY